MQASLRCEVPSNPPTQYIILSIATTPATDLALSKRNNVNKNQYSESYAVIKNHAQTLGEKPIFS